MPSSVTARADGEVDGLLYLEQIDQLGTMRFGSVTALPLQHDERRTRPPPSCKLPRYDWPARPGRGADLPALL